MTIRITGALAACALAATLAGCSSSGGGDRPTVSSPAAAGSGGSGASASAARSSEAATPGSPSDGSSGGSSNNGGSPAAADACRLVSKAEIEGVLGVTLSDGRASGAAPVSLCMYNPTAGATASSTVLVRTQSQSGHELFLVGKKGFSANGEPTKDVSGFGDEAYTSVIGTAQFATYTINARKGSVELLVTMSGPKSSLDKVEAIAKLGLARL